MVGHILSVVLLHAQNPLTQALVLYLKVLHKLEVHKHADSGLGGFSVRQVKVTEVEV